MLTGAQFNSACTTRLLRGILKAARSQKLETESRDTRRVKRENKVLSRGAKITYGGVILCTLFEGTFYIDLNIFNRF